MRVVKVFDFPWCGHGNHSNSSSCLFGSSDRLLPTRFLKFAMDIDTLELEFPWNDYLLETDPKETDPKEKVQPKAIARPDRDHDQPDQKSAGSNTKEYFPSDHDLFGSDSEKESAPKPDGDGPKP